MITFKHKRIKISNFKLNVDRWVDEVSSTGKELVIKQQSDKKLVLIQLSTYNSLKETIYTTSGRNGDGLQQSIKELESARNS
jgi:PHD/YefM family antitoxin component YafN of YafNO toxin-antitoxin module